MAELPESAEATPLLPATLEPVTDEGRLETAPPGPSGPVRAASPGAGDAPETPAHAKWRVPLVLASALATASAVVALGPPEEPPPPRTPAPTQPLTEPGYRTLADAGQLLPAHELTPSLPARPSGDGLAPSPVAGPHRRQNAPPVRPVASGTPAPHRAAPPPPSAEVDPAVGTALARYQVGDLEGARAALATTTGQPEAAAAAIRLDAVAHLLGPHEAWPPPGGAAALERLLELESALGLPRPSPLAVRALAELTERFVRKGHQLADDARWEEAAEAFRAALGRAPDHAAALAGLERVEQGAEALYLEGYLIEDENADRARRIYRRVLRLARPDGSLARRVAARFVTLPAPGPHPHPASGSAETETPMQDGPCHGRSPAP